MAKLYFEHLFIGWIGPPWLIERLAEFELGLYGQFIALSQVIIGFMLMTQRFRSLGAVMLLPMILNILMVTISQHWVGTLLCFSGTNLDEHFSIANGVSKVCLRSSKEAVISFNC